MNSPNLWLVAALLLTSLIDGRCADASATGMKGSRPNVVFFLADDQSRFAHTSYGHPSVPTPSTQKLSKEALVFDNAYTGQAICAPSRSMLYTGLYPIRNGCFINHSKVRDGVETLPVLLEKLGYTVILAGKSHVGPDASFPWSKRLLPVEKKGTTRDWIPLEEIDAFLANPGPKPFCLIIASEFPHSPYMENTPYKPEDTVLEPFVPRTEGNLRTTSRYYANVAEKEKELAAVMDALEKHNKTDDTLLFYADDHGLNRGKFTVYDSGLQVAFMVRWPDKVKPGRTDAMVSFADFVPTMIELAGGTPQGFDGKSMLPVLANPDSELHEYVYGVGVSQGIKGRHVFPQRSVRDNRYHYIRAFNTMERIERERAAGKEISFFDERGAQKHKDQPEEMLFDTQADPHEMTNLANDPKRAEIKERLKVELFRWMKSQNDYLTEDGPVPYLEVGKRFALDQFDAELNPIPKKMIGTLKGKKIHPHQSTAPKAKK